MRLVRVLSAVLMVCLLASWSGGARGAEPLKIRIGWIAMPSSLIPILFAKDGIARHNGSSYTVEAIHFNGTPAMLPALAAGELDIASLTFSSFGLAIQNAKLDDLRIIADEFRDGVAGSYTNEFLVLNDGPVRAVEDLKGKILASNARGSAGDTSIRAMLRQHHLDDAKDVTFIEVNLANMRAVLFDHKVDLISVVPPFTYDPGLRPGGRTLFTQKEALGMTQMSFWTARTGFLARNHDQVVDFMADALRALRWYTDPANRAEMIALVARESKLPPERFADWVFTKQDYYRDPNGLPDLDALQHNMETQRELGLLTTEIDVKSHADLSIVAAAAKTLP